MKTLVNFVINYLVYLMLLVQHCESDSVAFKQFKNTNLRGYKCKGDNVAFKTVFKSTAGKAMCMITCQLRKTKCLSIFYQEENRICHGCNSFFGENDPAGPAQDASLFYMRIVPDQFQYLGCYQDEISDDRLQSGDLLFDFYEMTGERCVKWCRLRQYDFALTQYFFECWCGNNENYSDLKVPEAECNTACTGDSSQKCGGHSRGSLYRTSP